MDATRVFFLRHICSWRRSITLSVIVAFIIVMLGESHGASVPTRVTIAYPSPSPRVAPLWVAQDLDLFGKYGLRAQVVLVRNNQMLSAGLISGDLEVGYTGGTTVLGAAAAGAELKMVGGFISRGRGFLTVKPEIRKTADLAGKRFGVQSIGGTIWMYAMLTLEQLGLDLARDKIQLLVVGDQTVMVRALETGIVDAAVMTTTGLRLGAQAEGLQCPGRSVSRDVVHRHRRAQKLHRKKSSNHGKRHQGAHRSGVFYPVAARQNPDGKDDHQSLEALRPDPGRRRLCATSSRNLTLSRTPPWKD